ncbi:hypothetical protein CLOP_g9154 [Closterium sp. NIES-67]|nr:hypothetical protein CLOP_g9154 [Closterium sp. NIES-67]
MTMAGPLLLRRAALAVLVLFSLLSVLLAEEGDSSASSNAGTGSASAHPVYLVHLRAAAVASYRGGVEGLPATPGHSRQSSFGSGGSHGPSRVRLPRVDMHSAAVKSYMGYLEFLQARVMEDAAVDPSSVLHSYKVVSSGFAAALSPSQLQQLQQHPAVVAVHRSSTIHMLSTRPSTSVDWLDSVDSGNLAGSANQTRHRRGLKGLQGRRGCCMCSGSSRRSSKRCSSSNSKRVRRCREMVWWLEWWIRAFGPSFSDKLISPPLSAPPSSWKGRCEPTKDFPSSACNRKLIGARVFYQGFQEEVGTKDWDLKGDWLSPRDSTGTGTWLAGAGSRQCQRPHGSCLRLLHRPSLWCGPSGTPGGLQDVLEKQGSWLECLQYAGVTVVFMAGDYGPPSRNSREYQNVGNYNPFGLTVGASSTSQRYFTTVTLESAGIILLADNLVGNDALIPYDARLPVVLLLGSERSTLQEYIGGTAR